MGIAHVALDGHILQFSRRFCEIAGYLPDDIVGKTCEQITFADDWKAEKVQMQRLLNGQVDQYAIEKRYVRMDGSFVWVNLTRSIQHDEAGRPEYFIVLVEDISQRERIAQILHDDLQQELAAAKFQLSIVRSRIPHDSPLQELTTQVNEILKGAIARSRSLSHELSPAALHHEDFAEALRWLANEMQAKHGLAVQVAGQARCSSEALKAFLYRAAQELLFNIVKHAQVNEAHVRVRPYGGRIFLSVSDRGRGFDPEKLRETTGFGLLSIRERIELLGGRMKIRSTKGKGRTFFVVVPDQKNVEDSRQKTEDGREADAGALLSVLRHPSSVLRVLVADDHRIVREGLRSLLREEYDIRIVGEAVHGRDAIDLAVRLRPDVVIMEVSMPLIDGDEATRYINACLPATRVIALSTYNEPKMIRKMHKAGAEGYVLKTASPEELLTAIRGQGTGKSE